jgi:hypothetical protein
MLECRNCGYLHWGPKRQTWSMSWPLAGWRAWLPDLESLSTSQPWWHTRQTCSRHHVASAGSGHAVVRFNEVVRQASEVERRFIARL